VEEAFGASDAWAWREEKRGGERSGEARGWCSPFIGAGEGHAGVRKGETAGGNGLNVIEVGWLNEGLRGGIKRGNQGGGVKTLIDISMLELGGAG
jgi:hypothetical protein